LALGPNPKFGKYTILVNASAESTTSVNGLAPNGVGCPGPERMLMKPNRLIADSL
jgi:hypothetical protein